MPNFKQYFLNEQEPDELINEPPTEVPSEDEYNEIPVEDEYNEIPVEDEYNDVPLDTSLSGDISLDNDFQEVPLNTPEPKQFWKRQIDSGLFSMIIKCVGYDDQGKGKLEIGLDVFDSFGDLKGSNPIYDMQVPTFEEAKNKAKELERSLKIS